MRKILTTLCLLGLWVGGLSPANAGWEEGVAAYTAKNYELAVKEFQGVVEQQPDEPSGHQMLGQSFVALKQFKNAVPALRKALELKEDPGVRLVLGQSLYHLRSYREVTQVLAKLDAAALPKSHQALLYQMRSVANQKIGRENLDDLQKAASLNPSNAAAQFNYGAALFKNGDTRAAVAALEKAVRLDGKDTGKRKTYVKALIRSARETKGPAKDAAYQKAEAQAKTLVQVEPSFDNLLLLGEVQLGTKTYDAAVKSLEQASAKKPSDWLPYYYIGQALTATKEYTEAEAPLKTALEKTSNPDDQKRIWGQLGFVYEKQKNFSASKSAYQKSGNMAGYERVAENERISQENKDIEKHNKEIEKLEQEAKALEAEMKALPGGSNPPR